MKNIYDWITEQMGKGEPASKFAPCVRVWSEIAVRTAILGALNNYEKDRQNESTR